MRTFHAVLFTVRCTVTVTVAMVSFLLIELPIQHGAPRLLRRPLPALVTTGLGLAAVATAAVVALPAGAGLGPSTATARQETTTAPTDPYDSTGQAPHSATRRHHKPGTPVSAVIAGDSIAWSLLHYLPPTPGVAIHDVTRQGCGLALGSPYRYFGTLHNVSRRCEQWPSDLRQAIDRHDPDVVVILFGRWETMDRVRDEQWTHIGVKAFDQ
ncbi:SGNH hydrolase domain-containing protein [Streptomyces rishiriensis]|uniref:SGNH hydrolase domain-containing protein n=1 Tax=Streptomyces rishiriensis TaxID=68264 RepID=UPI0027D86E2C|nr:SGNH hydrolase domain-containing protein [Streptomyces rishiriensis]